MDPVPLVQQLAHWLSLSAPPTVKLKLDVGDTPGRLQIDVSQLKQLLTNLVTNAIEACDANGGGRYCMSEQKGRLPERRPRIGLVSRQSPDSTSSWRFVIQAEEFR